VLTLGAFTEKDSVPPSLYALLPIRTIGLPSSAALPTHDHTITNHQLVGLMVSHAAKPSLM
jgi:hypothetical protein